MHVSFVDAICCGSNAQHIANDRMWNLIALNRCFCNIPSNLGKKHCSMPHSGALSLANQALAMMTFLKRKQGVCYPWDFVWVIVGFWFGTLLLVLTLALTTWQPSGKPSPQFLVPWLTLLNQAVIPSKLIYKHDVGIGYFYMKTHVHTPPNEPSHFTPCSGTLL